MSPTPAALLTLFAVPLISASTTVLADEQGDDGGDAKSVWVTSIAPIGNDRFVAATADGLLLREATVYSFDAADPNDLTPLYQHPAAVWRADATDDGSTVASVDYRGNLVTFDTKEGKATTHEKAFERWCQAMMISPDNKSVIAGNEAGKVMVWDLAESKVSGSVELDAHAVTGLAVSPDGKTLAATDGGGHVHLISLPGLEASGKIEINDEIAWAVAFVNDGSDLLIGSSDRKLYSCPAKADAKAEPLAKGKDWITQIAVSPGGQVAAGEIGGQVHFPSAAPRTSGAMERGKRIMERCAGMATTQLFAGTRKNGIVMAGQTWTWTEPEPPKADPPKSEEPSSEEGESEATEAGDEGREKGLEAAPTEDADGTC